jgi:hypothetical protein
VNDLAFEDWKLRAAERDIVGVADSLGAKLKRSGNELTGPCPVCGGRDRFSINRVKRIFNCRGAVGGDVIGMTMHLRGLDFLGACELLTGEPSPRGKSRSMEEAKEVVERRRAEARKEREKREREEQAERAEKAQTAASIWESAVTLDNTLAETYLLKCGLIKPSGGWPTCARFHGRLFHEFERRSFPGLVARVDDVGGDLTAVWREYIADDGSKAPIDKQKLGLGPAMGGAVRIGGIGPKIGAAEGFRTALGAWLLIGCRYPVWSLLATAGFSNVEFPLGVEEVRIFPDGDNPFRKKDDGYEPVAVPPGLLAARTLRDRAKSMGMKSCIEAMPLAGFDYEDIYKSTRQ